MEGRFGRDLEVDEGVKHVQELASVLVFVPSEARRCPLHQTEQHPWRHHQELEIRYPCQVALALLSPAVEC
jgi:hypothetical protein